MTKKLKTVADRTAEELEVLAEKSPESRKTLISAAKLLRVQQELWWDNNVIYSWFHGNGERLTAEQWWVIATIVNAWDLSETVPSGLLRVGDSATRVAAVKAIGRLYEALEGEGFAS